MSLFDVLMKTAFNKVPHPAPTEKTLLNGFEYANKNSKLAKHQAI